MTHLFTSDTDGALYDTRDPAWSRKPPLRAVYRRSQSVIKTCEQLKAALRYGPYTGLGCYPLYFFESDGEVLSFTTVRTELPLILHAIQTQADNGWRVVGCAINYEDGDLTCSQTNERIPSADED